jgi:hypothetical protein
MWPKWDSGFNPVRSREVFVKLLWAGILALVINLGCGGYGSGMGMTTAPAPAISPASGTYPTPLTVSIQDSLQGATIYVTVDGSTPALSSPIYRGPFTIAQSARIQATAVFNGYSTSPVAVANYTLQ